MPRSGLEHCIADVSLIVGRLSRWVGPPVKIEDGRRGVGES